MASLREVAALAEVSPMTVSNVLNGRPSVSPAIRRRVEKALRETGYVRNEAARALRAGRTKVVGVLAIEAVNPFYGELVAGIEEGLDGEDVLVVTATSHARRERELVALRRFAELRVRGVIATASSYDDELRAAFQSLSDSGVPVVLVADTDDGFETCTVSGDDRAGGRLAAEHLAALSVTGLGYLAGPVESVVHRRRVDGFREVLTESGLELTGALDCPGDGLADGLTGGRRLLTSTPRPRAVFCTNDLLALGLLQAATEAGLSVPDELAVLGYDDIPFAAGAAVPLSSVGQDTRTMGREAARLLQAETSARDDHRHQHLVVPPAVLARTSTQPAR